MTHTTFNAADLDQILLRGKLATPWQQIVESTIDGQLACDLHGNITFANPSAHRLLNLASSPGQAPHLRDLFNEEDQIWLQSAIQQETDDSEYQPHSRQLKLRGPKDRPFWADVQITPWLQNGEVTGTLLTIRDITAWKRREAELTTLNAKLEEKVEERTRDKLMARQVMDEQIKHSRRVTDQLTQSEATLRSLVDHAPLAILLIDFHGICLFCNRPTLGLTQSEILQTQIQHLIPERRRDYFLRALAQVFHRDECEPFEIEKVDAVDNTAWYSIRLAAVLPKHQEQPTRAVMMVEDITKRKLAEEALRKHQLESAEAGRMNMLGALTVELAHELNQPLQAINAYSEGCLRAIQSNSEAESISNALQKILQQSRRASDITKKIRGFVKRRDSARNTRHMSQVVEESITFAEMEAKRSHVQITLDLQPDLPLVEIDAIQIEQVLLNLIFNAIDATRIAKQSSPHVTVRSRLNETGGIEISVMDNGCGFDPAKADVLFQPLYTTKESGLGMGLSISRTIIDDHGGRIWARSTPGQGSTFTFVLPTSHTLRRENDS